MLYSLEIIELGNTFIPLSKWHKRDTNMTLTWHWPVTPFHLPYTVSIWFHHKDQISRLTYSSYFSEKKNPDKLVYMYMYIDAYMYIDVYIPWQACVV